MIAGYELREVAEYAALEYGDGTLMVDSLAQDYYPVAQRPSHGRGPERRRRQRRPNHQIGTVEWPQSDVPSIGGGVRLRLFQN